MTPNARSLDYLRRDGYYAESVERVVPRCFVRKDLFGCFDIVAVREGTPGTLYVQVTTASNSSARRKKILGNPIARAAVQAGNWVRLDSWRKSKGRWTLRYEHLALDQFQRSM